MPLRRLNHEQFHAIRQCLHEHFPHAFPARGEPCHALKSGVVHDLLAIHTTLGLSRGQLRLFWHRWAHRLEYLISLRDSPYRVGLDGNRAGPITRRQRAAARVLATDVQQRLTEANRRALHGSNTGQPSV